eukprot:TRINITY_DN16569_c0_g1::TRINITY_DN16569_c0_g1_i1::g.26973::m.26973 TRINITY_DN16569_c0_g1::TRINITY_DN16569_c0_g1_i1::g.26973  ORF type:complete len:278 (+),score=-33.94,sp/P26848/NU4M_MARPO/38.95/2e-63,Oxidored_q1/PF00361.15/1e-55 TRINITY_DN16569_c0_g1_i1:177-1010(+)
MLLTVVGMMFVVEDMMYLFIMFEATVIPMYWMVNARGSEPSKGRAANQLLMYTLVSSISFMVGLVVMYMNKGSTSMSVLGDDVMMMLLLGLPFVVKMPLYPVHGWLPEAHSEAPTVGSVLLAGILLKIGSYGLMRLLELMPSGVYWLPMIALISIVGLVYLSMLTLVQLDFKRIVAYTSITHMSVVAIGLFSGSLNGCLLFSIAHGLSASCMFLLVGVLYSRYHSRALSFFGGTSSTMPVFTTLLFLATLATVSFPGSLNFIAELMLLHSVYIHSNT